MVALHRSRPLPIGLQLGQQSVTLTQLTGKPERRELCALAHGEIPHEESLSTEERDRETAAVIRRMIADHGFRGRRVVGCLGSHELFVQNVRLPQLPADEIEKVVRWEAEERLPYPVSDAEIRYLRAAEVRQEAGIKQEVILLACHQGVVRRQIHIMEQAGLTPVAIDVEPCAVLRSLRRTDTAPDAARRQAFLSLDDRATTVIFTEGERILFLKYVSGGGHHLDVAVSRHLSLGLEEAARIRESVTASSELDDTDDVHRSVIDAIREPLDAMSSEIELCLRYYKVTFRGKPLDRIVVTGREASHWLVEFLSQRLGANCVLGNPFENMADPFAASAVHERPWRWTTAVGLSLKPLAW